MEVILERVKGIEGLVKVVLFVIVLVEVVKSLYESFGFEIYGLECDVMCWKG